MAEQIQSKQLFAKRRLSTIGEEDEVENRRTVAVVLKTTHHRLYARRPPENELKDSQPESSVTGVKLRRRRFAFAATLRAACSERFSESPLKGTPWEEAVLSSVSLASSSCLTRKLRLQRSAKEEESIEFCLKLFG